VWENSEGRGRKTPKAHGAFENQNVFVIPILLERSAPNYTLCPQNIWLNTGNLASPVNLVDTSQLPLGTFYDPDAAAQVKYGGYTVTGIQLVADGGWAVAGNVQTVLADNVMINNITYTFESADSYKKDGWQQFTSAPGPFKNQGACVSYFSHNN